MDLYDNFSIFTFLEASALFVFFKNIKRNIKNKAKQSINELSKCTLGIYITHVLIILIITSTTNLSDYNALLTIPALSIIVFAISFVITFIFRKILIIRKII